jgi:hypothetical protein
VQQKQEQLTPDAFFFFFFHFSRGSLFVLACSITRGLVLIMTEDELHNESSKSMVGTVLN